MSRDKLSKTDAVRNREESHSHTKISLEMALKSVEEARDWARSWPNNVTNLEQDLEQIRNRLRIILRSVEPVDPDGHVRIVPATPKASPYGTDVDTGETEVIVITDDV